MKTRFAPSPTGPFHIGGLRTALLVQALAQSKEGEAMLRIEDTDMQRSTQAYEAEILSSLDWAGIPFPGDYPRQSQRLDIYQDTINQLIDKGLAYYCYMTQDELNNFRNGVRDHNKNNPDNRIDEKYDNRYRPSNWVDGIPQSVKDKNPHPVVRLVMPTEGNTDWTDGAKGKIISPNSQLDDLIIRRSDGSPTYNFVVVVDDMDMGITDVIRGDDHINNTPKQIHIHKILTQLPRFINAPDINYTHLPLMYNPDGSKISKSALASPDYQARLDAGEFVPATLSQYKEMGILPKALVNYLLLISAQKTAERVGGEIFDMSDFMKKFKSKDLSVSPARFDMKKLFNINFKYINAQTNDEFKKTLIEFSPQLAINDIVFDAVAGEIKKRTRQLSTGVDLVNELIHLKDTVYKEFPNMTSFAQSGLQAQSDEELKTIFKLQSEISDKTIAEVSKQFREESKLQTQLPFYPVIAAMNLFPKKEKSLKI